VVVNVVPSRQRPSLAHRPWLRMFLVGLALWAGLWDSMHSIALYLTLRLTEGEQYVPTPHGWLVEPSRAQVNLFRPAVNG
jgi:hypothetical protein